MKKLLPLLLTFTLLSAVYCCKPGDAVFSAGIAGFWKVRQMPKNGSEPQLLYAQINDSIIQYWYEEVKYLLPYGYRVEDGDLIIWLPGDPNSRQANVGKLSSSGQSGFQLENDSQRLEFNRSTFEAFQKDTGEPWRKMQ